MHHDLPPIVQLSARLADGNARVTRFIDRMAVRADALMSALQQGDVGELRRLSEHMVATSDASGLDTVRYRAERVCQELLKPNNIRGIKRSVVHLIGACGARRDDVQDDWQI
jgi:hypothetical protein